MDRKIETLKALFPHRFHSRLFMVGGMVRDFLLGLRCEDIDLASSLPPDDLAALGFRLVQSKSTPDIYFRFLPSLGKIEITPLSSDHALLDDLRRRDFTINAMAMPLDGPLFDPLGGQADLEARRLRICNDTSLQDDPARIFRALRFECEGWRLDAEAEATITSHDWTEPLASVPMERFSQEMLKALSKNDPARFFYRMLQLGVGRSYLPELFSMPQVPAGPPEHHPEGDLFTHSLQVLERVASATPDPLARFCALFHDLGKLATPPELYPKHHGHDREGALAAHQFCRRLRLPSPFERGLQATAKLHLNANRWSELRDSTKIRVAIDAIKGGTASFLPQVVAADCRGEMPGWEEVLRVASLSAAELGLSPEIFAQQGVVAQERSQLILQRRVEALREAKRRNVPPSEDERCR